MSFTHRNIHISSGRLVAAFAAALLGLLVLASYAFADAANTKIPPNQHPTISATAVENLGDGHAGTPADPHTVTVTVTGGWTWESHGGPSDCNIDRAGTGVAVAWFDPQQPGNPLGNTDATAATVLIGGVPTPIFVGVKTKNPGQLNDVDNVVHPTENDIYDSAQPGGAVVDITDPAQFANWRGSCGKFSSDVLLDGTSASVSHGNFGRAAPGDTDTNGQPFNVPVPPANVAQQGALLTHTYRSKADVTRVCAVTYDVHGDGGNGKKAGAAGQNGVGIPDAAKNVTAGGSGRNDDNGVEKNANTPLGNACPAFFFPSISTQAGAATMFAVNGTASISDTATLSGADPTGGGNLIFKAYGPQADPNNYTCNSLPGGNLIGSSTVPVSQVAGNINHSYPSGSIALPAGAPSGDYVFTVEYQPTAGNTTAISDCNSDRAHETATVNKRPTTLTTDAGGNVTLDPVNGNDLTDTATLSGGTSDGTGTITFTLFKDSNNGGTGCDVQIGTATATVNNGADGKAYVSSPAIHVTTAGQYHWTASYGGDGKNAISSAACGDNKENPIVFGPTISTQATGGMFAVDGTVTISDVATLSGADPVGGGNLVFKAFGPQADPNNYTCTSGVGGNEVGTQTVPVAQVGGDINHDYTATLSNLPLTTFGNYVFTVTYEPTAGNAVATSGCNADRAHETAAVTKRPTTLTTDAGSRFGFDPVNGNDLTDTATLSGGTSDGTGTITFKLFKDNGQGGCAAQVGGDVTKAVNNGADGKQYTSPSIHVTDPGQYHWTASYDGDGKNSGSSSACGDAKENPTLVPSSIHVVKSGDDHVYHGDTMHFSYVVTNTGSGPLSNVTLSDDKCPNVQGPSKVEGANDTGAAFLDPGDVWTYTCQTPVPDHSAGEENPIVNTATAGAQDEFQRPVSDTDQHSTRILHPAIAIDKTGPATATQGDLVPYTLTVTNPGDESFAANTVVVADALCAAAGGSPPVLQVKNRGAGLDPSTGSLDPGDSWVYTCSVQSTAGQARIDNVADVNAADEFGHPVSATDTASTVLGQIVQLPEVTPGTARLAGASGCVARSFVASVRGKAIRKVVFSIDGKRRASVSKPDSKGRYKLVVNPRKFSRGSHLLVAKATFDPDSGTKAKTMRLRFSRCVRRAAPAFTG